MKQKAIPFRELLQKVLPLDRLSAADRARVAAVVREGDPRTLEALAFEMLDRLVDLGHLRLMEEVLRGDEKIRRYRDLTTGNTIALRLPVGDEDEGIYKIPLPLRDWKGATSLDQIRTLSNLYNKIITQDSHLLRGPGDILRQVMLTVRQILGCERVSFWMAGTHPEGGLPLENLSEEPYDSELAREWVLTRRYLVVLPELPAQIDPATGRLETEFHSLAMIPVGEPDQAVYGVLHAWSIHPHYYNEDRQGLLSLLSEFATDLLRLSEFLQPLVFVDPSTQIYNRTYFNLQLDNEIARARRESKPMALAIVDIDDFKSFNSKYGYEGGNQVLANTSQVLKNGLRPFDSVARWGGEEFALILTPPITLDDARAVCERLRRATELSHFSITGLEGESVASRITVSIGGAVYPRDGSSAASLWRAAEVALGHAKHTGKNKVVFASDLPPESEPPPERRRRS
jgi:diguanylate cyclase (GGDEF)-like protein